MDPTACERDLVAAETEFMQAMQDYKQKSGRLFPTWSEILEVLTSLGYQKVRPDSACVVVRRTESTHQQSD